MAVASSISSTGGLRDVSIRTFGASTTWWDVPGVMELNPASEAATVEQYGDDVYVRTFLSNYKGSLALVTSMTSMDILALVSGNSVSSTGGTESDMYVGTDYDLEPPLLVIRAKCRAQDDDSRSTTVGLWVWFHVYALKCQLAKPNSPPEIGNNKLAQQRIEFTVIPSAVDEANAAVATAMGHALYHIRTKTTAIW